MSADTKKEEKSQEQLNKEARQLQNWLRQKLRRISFQWPARKQALKDARVSRGKYKCHMCEEAGIDVLYGPKEMVLDHIDPVICPFTGWVDWNTYIERLFCARDGWQAICKDHHAAKTVLENEIRKDTKAESCEEEDI